MPRYVALFRGINVGKAKRIAMSDLRALFGKLGYSEVQTLLNSGNAVFTATAESTARHAARIQQAVLDKLGVDARVIVKSQKDIAAIMAGNELVDVANDSSRLLIAFTHDPRALKAVEPLATAEWGAEKIHLTKHAAYLWCADGIL